MSQEVAVAEPETAGLYSLQVNSATLLKRRVRQLMASRRERVTQKELATAVGRSESWASKFLSEGDSGTTLAIVDALAIFLGATPRDLFDHELVAGKGKPLGNDGMTDVNSLLPQASLHAHLSGGAVMNEWETRVWRKYASVLGRLALLDHATQERFVDDVDTKATEVLTAPTVRTRLGK
jgi:transcriptional regulator with XRE-family HTH domain